MKNIKNFLIGLDNDLWDLMGIECGSDFMNEDGTMNGKFDAYCKAVENELQANNIHSVSEKVYRELEDVKDALKEKAIKRGYPYKINKLTGRLRPASTTKVNTVEMGYLIDETIQLCAELGIVIEPIK